ncbi:MAG: hypothetical protein EZS28_020776, partial [Streblomastix strix]
MSDQQNISRTVTIVIASITNIVVVSGDASNAYVTLKYGEQESETSKISEIESSEFSESFSFRYTPDAEDTEIIFGLCVPDESGEVYQLGQFSLPIDQITQDVEHVTFTFIGVGELEGQEVGIIEFDQSYEETNEEEEQQAEEEQQDQPAEEEEQPAEEEQEQEEQPAEEEQPVENQEFTKGKLLITVIGVKDVTAMDSNGKSDPFIVVKFAGQEKKTKKVADTLNAEYNEKFDFDFDSATTEDRDILFELWDYNTFGSDEQIGKFKVPLQEVGTEKELKSYPFTGIEKQYGQKVGILDIEQKFEKQQEEQPTEEQQEAAALKQRKAKQITQEIEKQP